MIKELILIKYAVTIIILLTIIYKLFVVRQLFLSEEKNVVLEHFYRVVNVTDVKMEQQFQKTQHRETKCSACNSSEKKKYPT